jgi:hypothetical protein
MANSRFQNQIHNRILLKMTDLAQTVSPTLLISTFRYNYMVEFQFICSEAEKEF